MELLLEQMKHIFSPTSKSTFKSKLVDSPQEVLKKVGSAIKKNKDLDLVNASIKEDFLCYLICKWIEGSYQENVHKEEHTELLALTRTHHQTVT